MTPPTSRPLVRVLCAATLVLTVAACGSPAGSIDGPSRTATVERCGEEVDYRVPERALAYGYGSTDKLFALGLADQVAGYVLPPDTPSVGGSPWAQEYESTRRLDEALLDDEVVVDARADLVVAGWETGFASGRGFTPASLDRIAVQSYVPAATCSTYPAGSETIAPMSGLFTDLERLGQIFGVEDRASRLVDRLRDRVDAATARVPDEERPAVFVYDSGTEKPTTAGAQVVPTDLVRLAGGRNVFADREAGWTTVSWAAVTERAPDVIVVVDRGGRSAQKQIDFLRTSSETAGLPAVLADRIVVLPYAESVSSPRAVNGLEDLAAAFERFRDAG